MLARFFAVWEVRISRDWGRQPDLVIGVDEINSKIEEDAHHSYANCSGNCIVYL
jgi:hypothetical protein